MGVKPVDLADALGIERESYYRLERLTHRINAAEMVTLASAIGIRPDQLWFHPPAAGATRDLDLNSLVEKASPDVQAMVIKAVRGMVGG